MSNDKPLSQAQVAELLGVPASTIKYYTQLALLPYTQKGERGHKRYDARAVQERIELIGKLKAKGLTMASIIKHFSDRGLLQGNPDIYALSLISGATNG
jgi:DNA-binding transcriptional MerR regulator